MELGRLSRGSRTVGGALVNIASVPNFVDVALTNANMLALRATPISIVAAPGAGKQLEFVYAILHLKTVTAGYTETADNMAFKYTDGSGVAVSATIEATGFVDQVGTKVYGVPPSTGGLVLQNAAIVLHNTGDGEYGGGNASSVLRIRCYYRIHALPSAWGAYA